MSNMKRLLEWQYQIQELYEDVKDESDRALAILVTARIDQQLRDTLEKILVPKISKAKEQDELLDKSNAPLSTFSSRISMCYRLGLLDKDTAELIDALRDIRNAFAHSRAKLTFESDSIRDKVRHYFGLYSRRDRFVSPIKSLIQEDFAIQKPEAKFEFLTLSTLAVSNIESSFYRAGSIEPVSDNETISNFWKHPAKHGHPKAA